ncbi:hypothetical protein ACOMHN_001361 [Nucella lapillus]
MQGAPPPPYSGVGGYPSAPPLPSPMGYQAPHPGYYPPPGQPYPNQAYPPGGGYPGYGGYYPPPQQVIMRDDRGRNNEPQGALQACLAGLCAACACCCLMDTVLD